MVLTMGKNLRPQTEPGHGLFKNFDLVKLYYIFIEQSREGELVIISSS